MPSFGPVKRRDLIYYLREGGFEGPYSGGKHEFMIRNQQRLILPNPHVQDISKGLLRRLLEQAGITKEEWEKL
ncbi:MAG: type II toxin-antitoxin system HicA family toxin [Bacteroidetes bacterium]|nr:MAG: type II toxin-antitoxin system HicA family toxin [Bacteroidota bacterium]